MTKLFFGTPNPSPSPQILSTGSTIAMTQWEQPRKFCSNSHKIWFLAAQHNLNWLVVSRVSYYDDVTVGYKWWQLLKKKKIVFGNLDRFRYDMGWCNTEMDEFHHKHKRKAQWAELANICGLCVIGHRKTQKNKIETVWI